VRILLTLACAASFLQADSAPKITIDATGPFRDHVREIQRQSGEKFSSESPEGDVTLRVRNAGFYEALDALCRAQGNMTYLSDVLSDEPLQIQSDPWIEYPAVYTGSYKIVALGFLRFKMGSEDEERSWARVHLGLFVPPSAHTGRFGPEARWSCLEAVDSTGASVLPAANGEPRERIVLAALPRLRCSAAQGILLKDFDTAKGLRRLAGKVSVDLAQLTEVSLPAEAGKTAQTPQGTLTVKSVAEFEKSDTGSTWRVALEYTSKDRPGPSHAPVDPDIKIDGEWAMGGWEDIEAGKPFEVKTWRAGQRPKVVLVRIRTGTRTVDIPYEFKNLAWKDK